MAKVVSNRTPFPLTLSIDRLEPSGLFLRESMTSAKGGGLSIEVCKDFTGGCLIIEIEDEKTHDRAQYVLTMKELIQQMAELHLSGLTKRKSS